MVFEKVPHGLCRDRVGLNALVEGDDVLVFITEESSLWREVECDGARSEERLDPQAVFIPPHVLQDKRDQFCLDSLALDGRDKNAVFFHCVSPNWSDFACLRAHVAAEYLHGRSLQQHDRLYVCRHYDGNTSFPPCR